MAQTKLYEAETIDEIFSSIEVVEIEMVELPDGDVVPKSKVDVFGFDGFVGEPY